MPQYSGNILGVDLAHPLSLSSGVDCIDQPSPVGDLKCRTTLATSEVSTVFMLIPSAGCVDQTSSVDKRVPHESGHFSGVGGVSRFLDSQLC